MRKKDSLLTCVICTDEVNENDFAFHFNDEMYMFCKSHAEPFRMGLSLGQLEVDSKFVSFLSNLEDPISKNEIKKALLQFVPMTKMLPLQVKTEEEYSVDTKFETPKQIYDELSKSIIGQDIAKKSVSVSAINHLTYINDYSEIDHKDKHHVLMLGKSGSGKTLIANSIAKMLDLPFVIGDATGYSPTGFHGQDAESVVYDLLLDTDMNFELAERGIVFIDEIDKICNTSKNSGRYESFIGSTQSTFLKLIEGKTVKVPGPLFGDPPGSSYNMDTSRMLFFFGGAFNGLGEIVAKKMGKKDRAMGLIKVDESKNKDIDQALKDYEIFAEASREELVEALIDYGMISEFVGRIPTIAPLKPLSKEDLMKVLTESKTSPITKQKEIFEKSGYNLNFTEEYMTTLVDAAYKSATGTRALDSYVKKSVSFASFDLLSIAKAKSVKGAVIINKSCINNPQDYTVSKLQILTTANTAATL
jgi:ATP-dependent Clp protease ATP-binding subunit ClpX